MNGPGTVVAVGMVSRDTYFEIESLPVDEGKYCARMLGCYCGGMATNVAINLRILGHHVILVHCLGPDPDGLYIDERPRSHLTTNQLASSRSSRSFASLVFIERHTSRRLAILIDGDYPSGLAPSQLSAITQADFIYYDGSWPLDGKVLRACAGTRDARVMVNLEFPREHLSRWYEWADYGVHSWSYLRLPEDCAPSEIEIALRASGQSRFKLSGVTCGAKGGLFISEDEVFEVRALRVETVDTNGAGDAFQAGLIHGLKNGWKHDRSLRFAAAVAAVQCTVLGPNLGGLTQEQVMNRMESLSGIENR